MMRVHTYLNFDGDAEEAFGFYEKVFGGKLTDINRFSDVPEGDFEVDPADQDKVMHVGLELGQGQMLMASDTPAAMADERVVGTNVSISVHPESREEADRIFQALSEGGEVEMEMQDAFWGAYFGSLTDRFGVQWMVNHETGEQGTA